MLRNFLILSFATLFLFSASFAQKGAVKGPLADQSSSDTGLWGASASQLTFFGGRTTVEFSDEFVTALGVLDLNVDRIFPATLRSGRARFPISGGTVDPSTLRGEIIHVGGLNIFRGNTEVALRSFIIDTQGESIVLTGQVSANGSVVGRIPLFDLSLESAKENLFSVTRVRLSDVGVTLRPEAAQALNAVFEISAFVPGFPIGTASVNGLAFGADDDDDDDDNDDDVKGRG